MTSTTTTKISGPTGLGLMGMTWRAQPVPDEQAFVAMDAAIANGALFWSSAEFYGPPGDPSGNLKLIRRYFESHPENASKVTLFVKGCTDVATLGPACSRDSVRNSVETCLAALGNAKTIDVFGPARQDPSVPLSETMAALSELVSEGKIGGIGLSELGAATLEKAQAMAPLSLIEVEFSLWSPEILTNGVAATAKCLGVPIVAYAPLGRGFLTGQIRSPSDIPEGDIRLYFDRFQPENFNKNLVLVEKLQSFAAERKVTPAQLALAWVRAHVDSDVAGTIVPIPGSTAAERVNENTKIVEHSAKDKAELDGILDSFTVHGGRYNAMLENTLWA